MDTSSCLSLLFIVAQLAFMFYWLHFTLWVRQKQKGFWTTYTLWAMNNSEKLEKAMQQSFFCGSRNSLTLQPPIFSATTLTLCSKWSTAKTDPDQLIYHNAHNESKLLQSWQQFYSPWKSWKWLLMGHQCTSFKKWLKQILQVSPG